MEPLVWKTTTHLQALKSSFTEHTAALLAALLKYTHVDMKLLLLHQSPPVNICSRFFWRVSLRLKALSL